MMSSSRQFLNLIVLFAAVCELAACQISGSTGSATLTPEPTTIPASDFEGPPLIGNLPGSGATDSPTPPGSGGLQGVYYHYVVEDGYADILRFYDDGLVLAVSIGTHNVFDTWGDIKPWFNRDTPDPTFATGTYQLDDDNLTFSVTGPEGTVDYIGRLSGDTLTLTFASSINGEESAEIRYNFMVTRAD